MARNSVLIDASPETVFDVIDDGWRYADWVVGAAKIRGVDEAFPAVGSSIHHQVVSKIPVLSVRDRTVVLTRERPHRIELEARAWPFGEALVVLTVEAVAEGSRVTIHETPLAPSALRRAAPLLDPLIHLRNTESMRRFKRVVERRHQVA